MKAPTTISTTINNETLKLEIKNTIYCNLDIHINGDPDINYTVFHEKLEEAIKKNTTTKQIKFNKFRHKKNLWIINIYPFQR